MKCRKCQHRIHCYGKEIETNEELYKTLVFPCESCKYYEDTIDNDKICKVCNQKDDCRYEPK